MEEVEFQELDARATGQPGLQRVAVTVASLLGILAVWQSLLTAGVVSDFVLPPPREVAGALLEHRATIIDASLRTLYEICLGFGAAIVTGLLLAIGLTYSRTFNLTVYPPLLIVHAIPKTALAPILLIWFGFGIAPKVVMVLAIAFFPILIATIAGLRSVDPDLHELARTFHSSWFRTFWTIDFPHALPSFFAGLKVGVHLAVAGVVVAEFVAGGKGLASVLQSASSQFQIDLAFAVAIVISILSASLFGLVALVERLAVPWDRN